MRVAVDQTGEQRRAAAIDPLALTGGCVVAGAEPCDRVVLDHDGNAVVWDGAGAVDEADILYDRAHHHHPGAATALCIPVIFESGGVDRKGTVVVNVFNQVAGGDPFAWIPTMRMMGPVVRFGAGPWLALGYDACVAALRGHAAFSSAVMGGSGRTDGDRRGFGLTMLGSDPPDHTRLRGLVSHAFTPRRIAALEPRIAMLADALLDGADPVGFDLIEEFATPLPVTIIAEMLGIPIADRAQFKRWSDAIVSFADPSRASGSGQAAMEELTAYLRRQLEQRRTAITDDLIGALITAEEAGDRLSPQEALATCVLLLIAGNETTTNLIGNAVAALCDHGLLAGLAAEPALIPGAIEETLRFAPPVLSLARLARRDVEIAGKTIAAGTVLFVVLAAANRDPAVFDQPDRFEMGRGPSRAIAFGHGIHFCLGAPLARLEARVALETLLRRYPDLHRTEQGAFERLPSMLLYGPKRLPVAV